MTDSRQKNLYSQDKASGIHMSEVDEVLLTILDKEDQMSRQVYNPYSFQSRWGSIKTEFKSIALARISVTFLQHIEPFYMAERIHRFKALKQIYPDQKHFLVRFFEPKYLISNLIYSIIKFTSKDEINYGLKNKYLSKIQQNSLYSVGINYLSGGLAAASVFQFEMLYNILVQPNQQYETEGRSQTIKNRMKLNSQFQQQYQKFAYNKIIFSTFYFGTFDTLNGSIKNKSSTYSLLYYSILSSAFAQIISDPFQKATIAFFKNQQVQKHSFQTNYSHWLKAMMLLYSKNPLKLFENTNRFFHRLFFNSITLCYYEWMKSYYGSTKH